MPFLIKNVVTARNVNGESVTHQPGSVISDWELEDFAKAKIMEGSEWYRANYEPLTEREAHGYRVRATQSEQPHILNQAIVPPPFDDYIGLHPEEIVARLRRAPLAVTQQARNYERADGGMKRDVITTYVHPVEREPFHGYDDMDLYAILEKLEVLGEQQIDETKMYEAAHKNRPAIVEFEKDSDPAETEPVAA